MPAAARSSGVTAAQCSMLLSPSATSAWACDASPARPSQSTTSRCALPADGKEGVAPCCSEPSSPPERTSSYERVSAALANTSPSFAPSSATCLPCHCSVGAAGAVASSSSISCHADSACHGAAGSGSGSGSRAAAPPARGATFQLIEISSSTTVLFAPRALPKPPGIMPCILGCCLALSACCGYGSVV